MLDIYRKALEEEGCFKEEYPKVIKAAMKAVPGNIPEKMKALMAASELITYAGHLRKPIHWLGNNIPVNAISFLVGDSGAGKGLSVKSIRNLITPGMEIININRVNHAKAQAIEDAVQDGKKEKDWRKYYSKPRDLISTVSTLPGTMKHLAALEHGKLGSGYMYVDEIGSELVSNRDLTENIIALAIGYDTGEIAPKILKDDTQQVEGIKNLPYSALMFGSPSNIIYDEAVKRKFKEEFSTKISRRTFFCFTKGKVQRIVYGSIQESRNGFRTSIEDTATTTSTLTPWFTELAKLTIRTPLQTTSEVEDIFSDYKGYNEWLSDTMDKSLPISILHRQHLQWKSLKLAGALAILNGEETVTKDHYIEAIRFSEIFAGDMVEFEQELEKEPYELFSSYMVSIAKTGYANISIHKLRKNGFIKGAGSVESKMLELIKLVRSYDDVNKYEYAEGYIHFYEGALEIENEKDELA